VKQKYIEEQKEEVEMSMHDKPALKALEEENSQRQSHLERRSWWRMSNPKHLQFRRRGNLSSMRGQQVLQRQQQQQQQQQQRQ